LSVDKEEIGKVICSKCGGEGGECSKCFGAGKLDWIENVVGRKGYRIKPGVYVTEVDLSYYLPERPYTFAGFNRSKS